MGLLAKTYRDVVPRFFPPPTTFSQLSLFPVGLTSPRRSVYMSTCIAYRICFGILYEPWLPEPVPPATQVSPPGLVERSALVTPGPVGQSLNSGDPTRDKATPTEAGPKGGWVGRKILSQFWIKVLEPKFGMDVYRWFLCTQAYQTQHNDTSVTSQAWGY